MKHIFDDAASVLRIWLEGKMNSQTMPAIDQEAADIRKACPKGRIEFDLDQVSYITSAGLRFFMKLAKQEADRVSAVNASEEIMESFRETGLDTIIDISMKMRQVSVEGCEIIGQGANGVVYRLGEDEIIKVFPANQDLSVIERERARARAALLSGLPTALSYNTVRVGDSYGIVFEMINSRSLAETLREDEAHFERYAQDYAALLKKIHSTEGDPSIFGHIRDVYEEGIDYCRDWYSEQELDQLRTLLRSIPERKTLIHGDFHPRNIMIIDGELSLIDMGDMSLGDAMFDFLATAATQVNLVKIDPAFAEQFTGMKPETVNRLWNRMLELYYPDADRAGLEKIDHRIALFSKFKAALCPYFARSVDEAIKRGSVEDARQNLIPVIDELIRDSAV